MSVINKDCQTGRSLSSGYCQSSNQTIIRHPPKSSSNQSIQSLRIVHKTTNFSFTCILNFLFDSSFDNIQTVTGVYSSKFTRSLGMSTADENLSWCLIYRTLTRQFQPVPTRTQNSLLPTYFLSLPD